MAGAPPGPLGGFRGGWANAGTEEFGAFAWIVDGRAMSLVLWRGAWI
jgi:hypothetical protein